mmetsp:Transcript_86991/g.259497  ORF Transcript_86991/g.259497 Transcript_86991/m.259497 type:complete len:179 (-) Transcript_86991:93-629(-)
MCFWTGLALRLPVAAMLPPGGNALIVLATSIVVGVGGAHAVPKVDSGKFQDESERKLRNRVRVHACATCFVAAVFWSWALRNCIVAHLDLGVVSFLLAFAAALNSIRCSSLTEEAPVRCQRCMFFSASCIVAANYLLACFIVEVGTLLWIYMLVGVLVWFVNALFGTQLLGMIHSQRD